jgi:crossover junction endodeoxyribonuclease RuvC
MRIIGIDPGLLVTGFGCLECSDRARQDAVPRLVEAGVFRLGRGGGEVSVASRLAELDADIRGLLARLQPDAVAVESLFAHYKHPATAIVMGHARGVILLAVERAGLQLVEYKPNLVKKSLTGHGHAGKEQVQRSVQELFHLPELPSPPDMADAIAIALCALWRLPMRETV